MRAAFGDISNIFPDGVSLILLVGEDIQNLIQNPSLGVCESAMFRPFRSAMNGVWG